MLTVNLFQDCSALFRRTSVELPLKDTIGCVTFLTLGLWDLGRFLSGGAMKPFVYQKGVPSAANMGKLIFEKQILWKEKR